MRAQPHALVQELLTRFRKSFRFATEVPASIIARVLKNPNIITVIGLAISFGVPIAACYHHPALALVLLLVSSYMDALDGALARITGRVTRFGAILDSFSDRIEEFNYIIALSILGLNPYLAMIMMALSFSISYLRAHGELRGVKMEGVGLFERGERILMIAIMLILFVTNLGKTNLVDKLSVINVVAFIYSALCFVTVLQRLVHIYTMTKIKD